MHSGPVTGGVLRGQNARFQLFGDTMNQASRMESTGIKDRIQLSAATAQMLISSGKGKWIEKRPEKVHVKGIGLQETYFFKKEFGKFSSPSVTSRSNVDLDESTTSSNLQASAILEPLGAPRISSKTRRLITWNTEVLCRRIKSIIQHRETGDNELSQTVVHQLQKYVEQIASMYRDNPFHNYEVRQQTIFSATSVIGYDIECVSRFVLRKPPYITT